MRWPLPRSLPGWLLLILTGGLLITQAATLWIVSRDRERASNTLELFRLEERATYLVKLLDTLPRNEWEDVAARATKFGKYMQITHVPLVESPFPLK